MSNTLLTISQITNEALAVLENQLTFTKHVSREYDDTFARDGAKIGQTINVRKPARFKGRRGPTINIEGFNETSVPVTLNQQYGCDVSFTSKELTLDIDNFSERVLKPQIATVANMIDRDGLELYQDIYNHVGSPGTTPNTNLTYLMAGVKLDNEAAPVDDQRTCVINPLAQAVISNANLTLQNPAKTISDQYHSGRMGRALGFKFEMDQNIVAHKIGTYAADVAGGAVLANGAVSAGSSIALDGWTSGDKLNAGDIITFAGVYAVNPQNRESTGELRQFVVTANATADGSGNMNISVSPSIVPSGQNQTVTGGIADNAVVSVFGSSGVTTPQGLAFHKNAFTFASADLELPSGVWMAKRVTSKRLGISMRVVKAYDITNDRAPMRIDVLGGWKTLRAELAARVSG